MRFFWIFFFFSFRRMTICIKWCLHPDNEWRWRCPIIDMSLNDMGGTGKDVWRCNHLNSLPLTWLVFHYVTLFCFNLSWSSNVTFRGQSGKSWTLNLVMGEQVNLAKSKGLKWKTSLYIEPLNLRMEFTWFSGFPCHDNSFLN